MQKSALQNDLGAFGVDISASMCSSSRTAMRVLMGSGRESGRNEVRTSMAAGAHKTQHPAHTHGSCNVITHVRWKNMAGVDVHVEGEGHGAQGVAASSCVTPGTEREAD